MWSVVNRLPPSLHPTNHFYHLKKTNKQVFGCLIQCRTGHAFHGKYYHRFIITEPASCPYEESLQIQEQVWPTCEKHKNVLQTPTSQTSLGLECYETPRASVWGKRDLLVTRLRRRYRMRDRYSKPRVLQASWKGYLCGARGYQPVTCAPGRQPHI